MATWVITRLTFRQAARRKILLAALALGALFLGVYGLGLYFIQRDMAGYTTGQRLIMRNEAYNFMALAGLYVVNFLFTMMTVLTSVDTISGEIDVGTIHTLASKPVHRREIVLGKWLGFVGMLTLYLLLMAGGVMGLTTLITDYKVPNAWRGLVLMWLSGQLLLSVTLLVGTRLSTLANGVLVFALYGVAFLGGWVEQIGSFLENQTAVNIGILSSLLMPSEALWKRAAYEMRSAVVDAFGFSPFTSVSSIPSPAMIIYAVLYTLAALALAVRTFSRRDL